MINPSKYVFAPVAQKFPPIETKWTVLGKQVKALKKEGKTQKEIADWLGVSVATVRRYL